MTIFRFLSFCLLAMILVCFPTWDLFATQWEKTIGGSDDDRGYSVQQTADGGYIIAGYTSSFGAGYQDVYLIKTDADGNKLWEKTFGGYYADQGNSVQQTTDGGFIIAGTFTSWNLAGDRDSQDVYLIKTDANGDKLWEKTIGGPDDDRGYSVQQTTDGGYIIVGYSDSFGVVNNNDVYLIKTDASGDKIWEKTFGGSRRDAAYSVQQTIDGGFILAGFTESFGEGAQDVYLIKTNANGDKQWEKTFGGTYNDGGASVQQTTDGGYIITGIYQQSLGGTYNLWLIKTNGTGDIDRSNNFSGLGWAYGHSVQQTSDGGYIITGRTLSSADPNNSEVYLIYYKKNLLPKPKALPSIPSLLLDD